jgi:hypothetical protein
VKKNSYGAWQEIAWNGISFSTPKTWNVGTIGKKYLLLDNESGPVMEIKWSSVKGKFMHEKQFRRIASIHKKSIGKTLTQSRLPADLEKALSQYNTTFFTWIGHSINGKGLILYCPSCRQACLIQFYINETFNENIIKGVLSSFRDHDSCGYLNFNIFDIKARIPDSFKLMRHRFEPGLFELEFSSKRNVVTFHSWGPASFLLDNKSLPQFAATIFHISEKDIDRIDQDDNIFEWSIEPSPVSLNRFLGSLRIKHVFQRFRIKYSEIKNRIYGINVKGKKPFEDKFFDGICENYESL